MVWKGFPAFPTPLRMRPVSRGKSRLAPWVVPHAERPRSPGPLWIRTRCPDTSSKAALWVKAQPEGALTTPCVVREQPQVPHTAQQGAGDPLSNSRGKRSSLPQTRRGPALHPNSAGTLRSASETEREPEVPASPRDEALFHCASPSRVPRGPANPTVSLNSQRHPGRFPQIPGRGRGKRGFPAAPRERPRESFFNASRGPSPLP